MARTRVLITAICCGAIFVAMVDDSIAAYTVTLDDDFAAAFDNDYLSVEPSPTQLLVLEFESTPICGPTSPPTKHWVPPTENGFFAEPLDVLPIIMQC